MNSVFVVRAVFRFLILVVVSVSLFAGCATTKKSPMNGFSNGYDKITIARNENTPTETEAIKPEYITEIRKSADVVTVMHVLTVQPGQQAALLDAQVNELRRVSGKIPGLVSFNLHKGLNGKTTVNYAQFESKKSFESWKASSTYRAYLDAIKPFVLKSEPEMFEIVYIQQ